LDSRSNATVVVDVMYFEKAYPLLCVYSFGKFSLELYEAFMNTQQS